jgi:hypothetical protein
MSDIENERRGLIAEIDKLVPAKCQECWAMMRCLRNPGARVACDAYPKGA